MKRFLLAGMLLVLLLPAVNTDSQNSTAFNSVAVAGKTMPGGRWCECGTQACICDPGEQPCTTCPNQGLTAQQDTAQESDPANSINLGAAFSLAVGAAVLVLRLRQLL